MGDAASGCGMTLMMFRNLLQSSRTPIRDLPFVNWERIIHWRDLQLGQEWEMPQQGAA
jgi:hypothetical protein